MTKIAINGFTHVCRNEKRTHRLKRDFAFRRFECFGSFSEDAR